MIHSNNIYPYIYLVLHSRNFGIEKKTFLDYSSYYNFHKKSFLKTHIFGTYNIP